MNKEILVDANAFNTRVAVVEDGTPVELYVEQEGSERLVGNIYLGKVQNVLPGMQAAFINIGLERNAFLYAGDVFTPGDAYDELEAIPETRKIGDMLKPGQTIVVQVAKDPVGTKGARVTTHITLAGRSLVLMPTVEYIGVSRRIDKEEERNRLRKIVKELKPKDMGIIVRTASAGRAKEAFAEDIESLTKLYAATHTTVATMDGTILFLTFLAYHTYRCASNMPFAKTGRKVKNWLVMKEVFSAFVATVNVKSKPTATIPM